MKNLVTLKAEMVNEIEFIPAKEWIGNKRVDVDHGSDFKAKVSVKVGNAVEEITLAENSSYRSSYRRKTRTPKEISKYGETMHVRGHTRTWTGLQKHSQSFKTLKEAGIGVDYSDVLEQFKQIVKTEKHRDVLKKRLENWKKIRKIKEMYPNRWFHNFESIIRSDRNKNIKSVIDEVTFEKPSLEKYIDKPVSWVKITYKDHIIIFTKKDGSFEYSDRNNNTGRTRRAKREGTIFLKAITGIQEQLAAEEYLKKKRIEEKNENESIRLHLSEVLGLPVVMKEDTEYYHDRRNSRNCTSYKVAKYYLVLKQPENYYSSFKGIEVRATENYQDGGFSYTVKGCSNIRCDQFKSIVEILLDGRKVYPEIIVPQRENN